MLCFSVCGTSYYFINIVKRFSFSNSTFWVFFHKIKGKNFDNFSV